MTSRRVSSLRRAFSLIEIMVVVSLLSVIILGLMAMFNQTQKAFKMGMMQTDVLENGRLATDLLSRELEEIVPSNIGDTTNFLCELVPPARFSLTPAPLAQPLPPMNTRYRTNVLQEFFFLTHENQDWKGVGYLVGTPLTGVGTLYRFEFPTYRTNSPVGLAGVFDDDARNLYQNGIVSTNLTRIMDGVITLNLRLFDPAGYEMNELMTNTSTNSTFVAETVVGARSRAYFYSNAIPASVEFELGILEPSTFDKYKSIPVPVLQVQFLKDQVTHVHIFRQRVPVRNLDPSAYQQ